MLTTALLRDFSQFLDDESIALASRYPEGIDRLEQIFKKTFDIISAQGGDKVFKKWDQQREEFRGSFLGTAFEAFALGVGYHISEEHPFRTDLLSAAKELWSRPEMQGGFATGKSTERRLVEIVPIGRELLASGGDA